MVKVKALEWRGGSIEWTAITPFGEWSIDHDDDEDMYLTPWVAWSQMNNIGHFQSVEDAQRASEEDYKNLVLSALEEE